MAYEYIIDPLLQHSDHETEDTEDMRSDCNMSDRLTIDIDCGSYGSSECPSMTSGFSPLESPTPTPTTIYSQGSLASPGWPEGHPFSGHHFETAHATTPLRSSFRLAEMTSTDGMQLPYGNLDGNFDYLPSYADNGEQFWIQSEMPKSYDSGNPFPYQPTMPQYNHMARNYYHHTSQRGYLPESVSNPCLSRPIFHQPERLTSSLSMNSIPHWMPSAGAISPQTITPSQAFPEAPVTPPPAYSAFPASIHSFRTHTPTTPIRSSPMSASSGAGTPMSRLSSGGHEYMEDEFNLSSGMREGLIQHQLQRRPSKKTTKKPAPKQSLKLENLPSIIKQVQFRCKEPGCKGRFKRQEHLKRHMKSHSKEKPHVCWVPGCNRGFSRSDNLNAHYTKTHSKRGGRNRYVATLDETSPDYDPDFRGQLTPDGRPIYGSKLDDPIPQSQETDVDTWDD